MPAGRFAAGRGPAGFDPVADPSAIEGQEPRTPLIDPATHDAVVLPDGSLQGVHPVDQAVALTFAVAAGTIGSVPGQGHTLGQIRYGGRSLEAEVRQHVERDLAPLISRGDIRLVSVVTTRIEGGFYVDISYKNLRLSPQATKTVRFQS